MKACKGQKLTTTDVADVPEDGSTTDDESYLEKPDKEDCIPPPDGGFQAWMQVVCGFCLYANTLGILNAFGAFQTYYETELLADSTPSDISWIGTVQSCFIWYGATLGVGALYDWGYLRPLIIVGSILNVLGMFLTSFCVSYWQIILAQGVIMGIGMGCLFTPMVGSIAAHFSRRRGLAMGIAASGGVFGS